MDTIDFANNHKDLYTATANVKEIVAGEASFLTVDDRGERGGPAFVAALEPIFPVVYA